MRRLSALPGLLRRRLPALDRAARKLNPLLLFVVIVLALLDMLCGVQRLVDDHPARVEAPAGKP